ncbi:MAG: hypothetical protein IT563_19235 [Alphaproteobacteria bacterium]|nr:hypothetical protein [Alphaproteobacteria bacterium]
MSTDRPRADEAHRNARNYFQKDKQQQSAAMIERAKADAAEVAKTARLKALRLAKEAADREAAAAKAAAPRTKRAG